jgi:hypothetical protein
MTPKKKSKKKSYPRKKRGTWWTVGQVVIILGAVLMIVVGAMDIVFTAIDSTQSYAQSYTLGYIDVPYLGSILSIIMGALILWLSVDKRIYNRMKMIWYAILIIVLAIIGGNLGALVVFIGGLIIIFYRLSKE